MAEFPALPLWTDAYLADTLHLTDEQNGIYLKLLMLMWRSAGCRIPNDDDWLKRRFSNFAGVRSIIAEFCQSDGNWITQSRLVFEYEQARKRSKKQSDRAKHRWHNKKDQCHGNATLHPSGNASTTTTTTTTIEESKKDISSLRSDWPRDYQDQFWNLYPRKKAKKAAFRALDRIKKSNEVPFARLLAAIGKIPVNDPVFIPHPATWLNQGRWDDEVLPGEQNGSRGPRPLQDDRLSLSKAADRLIEKADRGEFTFGPRPSLLPESSEGVVRLLSKG